MYLSTPFLHLFRLYLHLFGLFWLTMLSFLAAFGDKKSAIWPYEGRIWLKIARKNGLRTLKSRFDIWRNEKNVLYLYQI